MSKQSKPIRSQCQHRSQCVRDAIWGTYAWAQRETDVNVNRPLKIFCGQHKPRLNLTQLLRNVKLLRAP